MSEHMSVWETEGAYGSVTISCACRGLGPLEVPDAETAGDVWGDHMYEVGRADGLANRPALAPAVGFVSLSSDDEDDA